MFLVAFRSDQTTFTSSFISLLIVLVGLIQQKAFCLSIDELYPFGRSVNDESLIKNNEISKEVPLSVPINFFQNSFSSIYVNDNGMVSFMTEVPSFYNGKFPLQYPIIAPMYSNVDTREHGTIFFRESKNSSLLERASRDVQRHFREGRDFRAQDLLIATWHEVGRFDKLADLLNTVQLVIATDSTSSYCFMFYPENGIQWLQGKEIVENSHQAFTQAGVMSNNGQYYILPGSGTEQMKNYPRMSNVNRHGIFMFKIGGPNVYKNILLPDQDYGDTLELKGVETCSNIKFPCLPSSDCLEFPNGVCCQCKAGFFGNGRSCIPNEDNIRINGKINGEVNNVKFTERNYINIYVESKNGRVYASINHVNSDLGNELQSLLVPLGQIVGWLFAIRHDNLPNGYGLTGGVFNRTVNVVFQQTGHQISISEEYLGLDMFNVLNYNADIRGTLPTIPSETSIQMDDYKLEFTKVSLGVLKSRATISFNFGANTLDTPMIIDQTIVFDECPHQPQNNSVQTTRLSVNRNHLAYDAPNSASQYAFYESRISLFFDKNPCENVQCGQYSSCIVERNDYRCLCDRGFEPSKEFSDQKRPYCVDSDECRTQSQLCHPNARCINVPGSFQCQCLEGFIGDGFVCENANQVSESTCANIQCGQNAECIETKKLGPRCICKEGFYGNGLKCQPTLSDADDCRSISYCDFNAECKLNRLSGQWKCVCKPGFRGDGIVCPVESESCEKLRNCGANAECISDESSNHNYYCRCNQGFVGDGYECVAEINSDDCNVMNNCHRNAQCSLNEETKFYQCQCSSGFVGDGYRCLNQSYVNPCNGLEGCSPNADCVYDSFSQTNVCRCRPSFVGNGLVCNPSNECYANDPRCDVNAQCLLNEGTRKYECQCKPGFNGNGLQCLADEETTKCNVVNDCDRNATCAVNPLTLEYYCKCNVGFEGNGKKCRKFLSCNMLNNCDVKAECIFDTVEQNYRCHCNPGFVGDGYACRPLRSCREDGSVCDRNAECIYATDDYKCQCRNGFIGDGYKCSPLPTIDGDYILFAQGMSLLRMPLEEGEKGYPLFIESDQTIVGLDVDCLTGSIFWTDMAKGNIRKAASNGSSQEVLLDGITNSPESLAIDWVSRNFFWTDSFKKTIEVANLEGVMHKVLINTDLVNPRGIAVHPGLGKIYWTDWNRESPKIEQANMDGKKRTVLIKDGIKLPNNLVIDYDRDDLCWTDAELERIECIHLITLNRRMIYAKAPYPFDLAISNQNIYWTDWKTKSIHQINRNGGVAKKLEIPMGGYGSPYGIVAVARQCPRISNVCAIQNGGCKHLCLPSSERGGRVCACPDTAYEEDNVCNEI